jgi:hypothetical protein
MLDFSSFHPSAREEFLERVRFQTANYPELADEWLSSVETAVAQILKDPLQPREREFGHRRVNLGKFPHYLAYIVRGDRVWFVAFGSGSQDHLYWKERLEPG